MSTPMEMKTGLRQGDFFPGKEFSPLDQRDGPISRWKEKAYEDMEHANIQMWQQILKQD